MADIHLDYAEIQQRARTLRQQDEDIQSKLRTMQSDIQALLDSGFKTQHSSIAFGERFQEFKTNAANLISTLTELGHQLDQIVSDAQGFDQGH